MNRAVARARLFNLCCYLRVRGAAALRPHGQADFGWVSFVDAPFSPFGYADPYPSRLKFLFPITCYRGQWIISLATGFRCVRLVKAISLPIVCSAICCFLPPVFADLVEFFLSYCCSDCLLQTFIRQTHVTSTHHSIC
jgi:hypothetical protein